MTKVPRKFQKQKTSNKLNSDEFSLQENRENIQLVAPVPYDPHTYHIFQCPSWNPEVHVKVQFTSSDTTTTRSIRLHPYVQASVNGWTLRVISLQQAVPNVANSRFAESHETQMMLSNDFKIAVECPNEQTSMQSFNSCRSKVICACSVATDAVQCACPQSSFRRLLNTTAVLPLITPHYNITAAETVWIDSYEKEATLLLTSRKEMQMALLDIDPPCSLHATSVTGCYSCAESAKIVIHCNSTNSRELALDCSSQSLLIKCSTQGVANHIMLEYDHAHVQDHCTFQCGAKNHNITLAGTLLYHSSVLDEEIFDMQSESGKGNAWNRFSIPDITPLAIAFIAHWKISLAVIAVVVIIAISIYAFGPTVVVAFIKIIAAIIEMLLRTLFACLSGLLRALLQTHDQ
ncbi:hypothetical protein Q1695_008881 [Nippostrongylus brasiliensis]|nr:hypothetical protein Q1695_008881 [Nippostrongylus brasiliensis]